MFTGIVQGKFELGLVDLSGGDHGRLGIRLPPELRDSLERGDSISIDGVCLTVRELPEDLVILDVIKSTVNRTIVSSYEAGHLVNAERSMTVGSEIGGHEVSGHVDTRAVVDRIERTQGNVCVFFRVDEKWGRYLFPQGFVAINGASLTISDCLESGALFSVWLIPETLDATNLGNLEVGDRVNVEIHRGVQVIVDTIERTVDRFLLKALDEGKLDGDLLEKLAHMQGFLTSGKSG